MCMKKKCLQKYRVQSRMKLQFEQEKSHKELKRTKFPNNLGFTI